MASDRADRARDGRSGYDYQGGVETVPAGLAGLPDLVDGEVRFDAYTRQLYATDASIYEVTPLGVVFPVDTEDVSRVLAHCWSEEIPVLPRGAGTSLAGQAVNEAVVLDFTAHMDGVRRIDADERTCRAQPGIVLAALDEAVADTGLQFAPDPAWGDKSTLGGAIGNNSTGAHSLRYGKTDEYVESCEVVLADGTVTEFGWCTLADVAARADPQGDLEGRIYAAIDRLVNEEAETIEAAFPDLHRNVAGYNLDRLIDDAADGRVNVARLLAGSEGTLGIVTEATVGLEPVPETTAVALLTYADVQDAMRDVPAILEHDPAAVESIDDVLLELAAETDAFGPIVDRLPPDTGAVLLVEFDATDAAAGRERIRALLDDRTGTAETVRAVAALEAHDATDRTEFWTLRKCGLPILLGRTTDEKHIAFIEDTAVPAEHLAEYVADVRELLAEHDTFASFYGHAGPGCLHIRPLLNTKTDDGVERVESIAAEVAKLAGAHGGTIAGEHGNGRARTQFVREQYGDEVLALFRELKAAWDPKGLLNPGQVCGDVSVTEHLRFDPDYAFDAGFEPTLRWENDNGMQGMVELCHGCGGCRGDQSTVGGVMCPTYRASHEEITSTRGRANLLRQAMSGDLPAGEALTEEFLDEVLDLCIGCKGCARDCPSEVDMAKLKAELTHARHQRQGASLRDRLFADIDRFAAVGSAAAPVSNWLSAIPGADRLLERTLGIARDRSLPRFSRRTLHDRLADRSSTDGSTGRVLLFPDTHTTYVDPEIGVAAATVLESLGYAVELADGVGPSGRAAFSMGFLDRARARARHNVEALADRVGPSVPLLCLEPSDAVMFQSDYHDLLGGEAVERVSGHTYGVMEFLDRFETIPTADVDARLTYHGHCHQKATGRAEHAATVLGDAGFTVDALDSGCCGMAGSFGYEAEHYAMSKAIAGILYDQVDRSPGDRVVASGASCRTQLADHLGEHPAHPVEVLAGVM